MMLYRDQGIVLRTQKLGEADRIITLFLRGRGIQRMVAKGVRKTSSKFGARLEPFMVVDLQGFQGRTLDTITQTELLDSFGTALTGDLEVYAAASSIVEVAEKINDADVSFEQYRLLYGALRALALGNFPAVTIRDAYLMRAMSLAGWAPGFGACSSCGATEQLGYLSVPLGGAVCEDCRAHGAFRVRPDTISLLTAYLEGDWQIAGEASDATRTQAAGFIAAYIQWHLEKNFKSFGFTSRMLESRLNG